MIDDIDYTVLTGRPSALHGVHLHGSRALDLPFRGGGSVIFLDPKNDGHLKRGSSLTGVRYDTYTYQKRPKFSGLILYPMMLGSPIFVQLVS